MKRRSLSSLFGALPGLLALLLLASLGGCELVFTTSLLSFLQRDPATLSAEQQIAWAEQALASGDPAAMAEAYDLVKNDPAQELLAAHLALELSGVPAVMNQLIQDLETVLGLDESGLESYFDALVALVDTSFASAAGTHFAAALAGDPSQLSGLDMVLGALCLAFAEADPGGFAAVAPAGPTDTFIADSLAALDPEDPAADILDQLALMI